MTGPNLTQPAIAVRYDFLDALRASLMMFGVVLHSFTLTDSSIGEAVFFVSGLVRMEAFFVISGFVTALVFEKYGHINTLKKRLITIGVPLAFGLAVLNPATNYLVYIYHNEYVSFYSYLTNASSLGGEGPMVWHLHLWFLIPLLVYGFFIRFMINFAKWTENNVVAKLKAFPTSVIFIGCIALVVGCCVGARLVFSVVLSEPLLSTPFPFVVRETLYNAVFFALGCLMFQSKTLFRVLTSQRIGFVLFGVVMGVLYYRYNALLPESISKLCELSWRAYMAIVLTNFLMFVFKQLINTGRGWVRYYSDASYSVYILHYGCIYVFANLLVLVGVSSAFIVPIVSMLVFVTLVYLHHHVIKRNRILSLLLNGKKL